MKHRKVTSTLLKHFGGDYEAARKLKVSPFTVLSWKRKGIPLKYWNRFMKAGFTTDQLFATRPNK